MNNKDWFTKRLRPCLQGLLAATAALPASAGIIGSDVINSDGTVTYSYIVDNTGGTLDISAWSIEFGFPTPDWKQSDSFSGGSVAVPNASWFADAGIPVTGQSAQDFVSLSPGGDVAAGKTQSGFSFTSTFQPGTVSYLEFSAGGDSIAGHTVGPIHTVPEGNGPLAAMAFVGITCFGLATRRSRLTV